jgi:hypothetical protein
MHAELEASTLVAYHLQLNTGYETEAGKVGRVFLWAVLSSRKRQRA